MRRALEKASQDYRHLLEKGYNPESARRFVCDHHLLSKEESWYLLRCILPSKLAEARRRKLASAGELRGKTVIVDGYNALITLESRKVFVCDDGFLRDLSGVFGNYRISAKTKSVLAKLVGRLKRLGVERVLFYFDKNVSRSGELAALARKIIAGAGLAGDAETLSNVDGELKKKGASKNVVVVTTDSVIIDEALRVLQPRPTAS